MIEHSSTSVLRVEDPRLLKGDTTFVANLALEGVAVAHYVTSVMAHARIENIDTSEAEAAPGVLAVLTAADLPVRNVPGHPENFPAAADRPILASGTARFVGEPLAVIVAESHAEAADAAELVVIDYQPLPAVIGIDQGLADDTLLFPEHGSNVMTTDSGGAPDPFPSEGYDVVVEHTILNQRLAPCPIETRVAAAWWTDDGRLVHHASCQGVHPQRAMLAAWYQLDSSQVRVTTADVGGSFGAKARMYPEELLLGFLAKQVGRPVRWTPSRSADMAGLGHSRAQKQDVRIAGNRDGTIVALDVHVMVDCGAFPIAAPHMSKNTGVMLPGPLHVPQTTWRTTAVATNTTPIVAYRGAGRPESGALLDRAVDLFAQAIGMDPLDVRRKNLITPDQMPYTNPSGVVHDSGDYPTALTKATTEAGYAEVREQQAGERASGSRTRTGIGLSTFIDRTAGATGTEYGSLELLADGSLRVLTGSSPYGQGHYTTWSQLVSERTGVAIEHIQVVHGDTDVVPRGGITGGSRSAQKAGSAVAIAADDLVAEAKRHAGDLLEAAAGDVVLDIATGRFHVAGAPAAASIAWPEIARALVNANKAKSDEIAFACETDYDTEGPSVPYGAYAAIVKVDLDTGLVRLDRMISVDDAGTLINPMIVLGQVHGGVGQAIGQAMYEEFVYDDDGNPLTSSFLDYAVPSAAEMPSFEAHLMETPSPNNPLGAKGIAESGTIGAVPAIQNAVVDALADLGVTHIDLPVTAQRVWQALAAEAG